MHSKSTDNKFLSLIGMGVLVALAPLACGDDDDDDTNNGTAGTSTGGKGGNTATGGKSGSGGRAGSSGNSGSGGKAAGGSSANTGGAAAGEAGGGGEGGAAGGAAKARIRVIHASPNAPSVDVYAKDSSVAALEDVAYGDASDFIEVDAGPVAFDLRAAGSDSSEAAAFTTEPVELSADTDYSLVAAGDFAQVTDADVGFRVLALEHDFSAPVDGEALVRVVHATPTWASVDVDVLGTSGVDIAGLGAFESESNVALPAATGIDIALQTAAGDVLSKLALPEFEEGTESLVIATGNPGLPFRAPANGFALLVVDQDGNTSWVKENPWLHVLHVSDVGTVDLYDSALTAPTDKLADDLAVETLAGFQLPASAAGVTLKAVADEAASGAATSLASGATSTLAAGEHYLAYIAGDTIETLHEQFDLEQPTKVLLRGVHASVTLQQTVDFGIAQSSALTTVLIPEVAPAMASAEAGAAINPGNAILGAAATGTLTPLLAEKSFTSGTALQAGERGFVLLSGAGDLWFVDTSVSGWSVR
jgi:hypothetical protein